MLQANAVIAEEITALRKKYAALAEVAEELITILVQDPSGICQPVRDQVSVLGWKEQFNQTMEMIRSTSLLSYAMMGLWALRKSRKLRTASLKGWHKMRSR